jgi:rfaE bifunctional protein, domain I
VYRDKYRDLIARFADVKILVIGDLMLDRYWWGSAERISPEAPVPVVRLERTSASAGGAANVAANIAGLGAKPILAGIIGDDPEGAELCEILRKQGVSPEYILKSSKRQTIVKTRLIAHNQHVVRIDREETRRADFGETDENFRENLDKYLEEADLVLVSDYAKGLLTEDLLSRLITQTRALGKRIYIDPKGKDFSKYRNATLLTPNQKEAVEASRFSAFADADPDEVGKDLLNSLELDSIIITRGENGMSLYRHGENPFHLKSLARKVYDVTGAGDTVISTLAVASAAGASLEEAAELSNIAAGLVVEEVGTSVITREKLSENLS